MHIVHLFVLLAVLSTPCLAIKCYKVEMSLDEFKIADKSRFTIIDCRTAHIDTGCSRHVYGNHVELNCLYWRQEAQSEEWPLGCKDVDMGPDKGNCGCQFDLCNGEFTNIAPGSYSYSKHQINKPYNEVSEKKEMSFGCYECVDKTGVSCVLVDCGDAVFDCVTIKKPDEIERTCGSRYSTSPMGCVKKEINSVTTEICHCDSEKCNNEGMEPGFRCHECVEEEGKECPITDCGVEVTACVTARKEGRVERSCGDNFATYELGCHTKMVESVSTEFCHCAEEMCNSNEFDRLRSANASKAIKLSASVLVALINLIQALKVMLHF